MKNVKKNYCYLVRRKRDGKLFCTYGNFKEAWNRPKYLFNLVSSAYIYAVKLPFGNLLASNVSSDLRYNSKDYSVIRQAAMQHWITKGIKIVISYELFSSQTILSKNSMFPMRKRKYGYSPDIL